MLLQKYSVKVSLLKSHIKFHFMSYINGLQASTKNNDCRTETYDMVPHDQIGVVRKRTTWHSMCLTKVPKK